MPAGEARVSGPAPPAAQAKAPLRRELERRRHKTINRTGQKGIHIANV
jgi:hypothetical protein